MPRDFMGKSLFWKALGNLHSFLSHTVPHRMLLKPWGNIAKKVRGTGRKTTSDTNGVVVLAHGNGIKSLEKLQYICNIVCDKGNNV